MSNWWSAFRSMDKKAEEILKNLDEIFREYTESLFNEVLELSEPMWKYLEEKTECDHCGAPIEKAKGWLFIERDYQMKTKDGEVKVDESSRMLYCPKCSSKLTHAALEDWKKKKKLAL